MKPIKQLPMLILAVFLFGSAAAAQEPQAETTTPGPIFVYQSNFPILLEGREYNLLTAVIDFPTGAGFPKHFHGGQVLVTVLSGEMTLVQGNAERVVKTGESWTENPGDVHSVANRGPSARVVVSMVLPKGAQITTPIEE